jgi:hypothetical protein
MSEFSHDGQLEIALALAKRVHEFAIKGNDDALTTRERRLVDEYLQFQFEYSDLDTEEGFIRSWVRRRAVGLPARPKLKRKQFLRRVSETLRLVLVGFTEHLGTEYVSFERTYNKWTVQTSVYIGRPPKLFAPDSGRLAGGSRDYHHLLAWSRGWGLGCSLRGSVSRGGRDIRHVVRSFHDGNSRALGRSGLR